MFRYALRRILWAIPTLLATSLVLFLVTTLAPAPHAVTEDPMEDEALRGRFLDLPRFFNSNPPDVRTRTAQAVALVANGDAHSEAGARALVWLGGAALPWVLPTLESLPPDARGRVAVALAPLAERLELVHEGDLTQPDVALLFWTHFWEDRALDFTRPAVARAVGRLVEHGSDLREKDLLSLDTFALPEVVAAMAAATDGLALERLTRLAHHATRRGPELAADAAPGDVRRAIADWREWWFVHDTDFIALDGADRVLAMFTETRYGKWLKRAASGQLGVSVIDGEPIAEKLRDRAPITVLVCSVAMLLSWLLAIPIGALSAWRRGKSFDTASGAVLFVMYAMPTFAVAEVLRHMTLGTSASGARVALAVIALAVGSFATLSRWQRGAMLEVVGRDYVRTARAKGMPAWRIAVVHALRNALMPTVTLAGLHLPVLLGGAFVVEEVFALPGIGFETLRAIEAHDAAWLMAVVLVSAVAVTFGLVASDVAYGVLDPRVREVLRRRERGPQT
ncbi:MAG TPA: ABC transporter permease [Polyangiaceae bacterium]|nr:ABC transporter permease [Polyangiaceae bacterium]